MSENTAKSTCRVCRTDKELGTTVIGILCKTCHEKTIDLVAESMSGIQIDTGLQCCPECMQMVELHKKSNAIILRLTAHEAPCKLPCCGGTFSPEERFHDRACTVCREIS